MCSYSVSQNRWSQQGITFSSTTLTLGKWCKVCSKLTYALEAFSTPKIHDLSACSRLVARLTVSLRYDNVLNIIIG
jgi:hypothetical protein